MQWYDIFSDSVVRRQTWLLLINNNKIHEMSKKEHTTNLYFKNTKSSIKISILRTLNEVVACLTISRKTIRLNSCFTRTCDYSCFEFMHCTCIIAGDDVSIYIVFCVNSLRHSEQKIRVAHAIRSRILSLRSLALNVSVCHWSYRMEIYFQIQCNFLHFPSLLNFQRFFMKCTRNLRVIFIIIVVICLRICKSNMIVLLIMNKW